MRAVVSFLFLTALVCLALEPRFTGAEAPDKDVPEPVERACGRARNKDYCINLLKSDKDYINYSDRVQGLGYLALKIAKTKIEETATFITSALERSDLQAAERDALTECDKQYKTANEKFVKAIDDYDALSHVDTKTSGNAAVASIDACNAKIKDKNAQVAEKNHDVRVAVNTALSVSYVYLSEAPQD